MIEFIEHDVVCMEYPVGQFRQFVPNVFLPSAIPILSQTC